MKNRFGLALLFVGVLMIVETVFGGSNTTDQQLWVMKQYNQDSIQVFLIGDHANPHTRCYAISGNTPDGRGVIDPHVAISCLP